MSDSVPNYGSIADLLEHKRVLVLCGAGGVGKTTASASMALAAARAGRRVLVVTIDPSRRLAETLGVSRNPPTPVSLPADRLKAVGIKPPGSLHAWMLDPKLVSDKVVKSVHANSADVEDLLSNRIYRNVTSMVAGMQEYTAVEALHDFIEEDVYDLVILDTPPSRNALRFLEAPSRAGAFLDKRIFNLFVPGEGGLIRRMATNLIERVMDRAFGSETRQELQQFFTLFSGILSHLNHNQAEMRRFFTQPDVGFLLVTSPAREAVEEAFYFERKTRDELGLPLVGYILNRSMAWASGHPFPDPDACGADAPPEARSALEKLAKMGANERDTAEHHATLAHYLHDRVGDEGVTWVLPMLAQGANDLEQLVTLADALTSPAGLSQQPKS